MSALFWPKAATRLNSSTLQLFNTRRSRLTPRPLAPYVAYQLDCAIMNAKLLLKTIFIIIILLLLVLMGMHNRAPVNFILPPLFTQVVRQPAAIMYFAFFAIGVLTGTILTAGLGKKTGSSRGSGKSGDR